jgi:ribosome biogenesis GTPase / thiamine phosphate phosphatase
MNDFPFDLAAIGASDRLNETFQPHAAKGLELARISAVHREQYRLYTSTGERRAEAIGALIYRAKSPSDLPAVGDWVAVQTLGLEDAMVHAILPRHTVFSRRAPGEREEEQVIAANVDLILIVCGLDHDFNLRRIERYLAAAQQSGADSAVILNKSDLCHDPDQVVALTTQAANGAPVIQISALSGTGIREIRDLIPHGITAALTGSSGVGKSTLMNRLLGENRQQVNDVRESDSRGRHTTTHRELIPLPGGGCLIDSPGMRELQLWAGEDTVGSAFEDILQLKERCRFRDCTHQVEKGCEVLKAVEDGRIHRERWQNYLKLAAEGRWHERKTDIHAALEQKRQWKAIHKAMRGKNR